MIVSVASGFPGGSEGKESACHAGDLGSIPGLERSPGEGNCYPFQSSGLENSTDYSLGLEESDTAERLSFIMSVACGLQPSLVLE